MSDNNVFHPKVSSGFYDTYHSSGSGVEEDPYGKWSPVKGHFSARKSRRSSGRYIPAKLFTGRSTIGQEDNSPYMVYKRGGLTLAEKEIKQLLEDLRAYRNTPITELNQEISVKFSRLGAYIHLLFDTPDYPTFYNWIIEKYSDQENVDPATVGGYLIGCHVKTSFYHSAPGCAISCAGSVPRPKHDHTFQHCKNTVLRAIFDGNVYTFSVHKKAANPEDHANAYLYIKVDESGNYSGFSEAEKRVLLDMGVKYVKLYSYKNDGRIYDELTAGLVAVEDLPSRNRVNPPNPGTGPNNPGNTLGRSSYRKRKKSKDHHVSEGGWTLGWIIRITVIIIIIIIIIVIIVWLVRKFRGRSKHSNTGGNYHETHRVEHNPMGEHHVTTEYHS